MTPTEKAKIQRARRDGLSVRCRVIENHVVGMDEGDLLRAYNAATAAWRHANESSYGRADDEARRLFSVLQVALHHQMETRRLMNNDEARDESPSPARLT